MTTPMLDAPQRQRAIEVMREYLDAAPGDDGRTPKQTSAQLDEVRVTVIDQTLHPLVLGYLTGSIALAEFPRKIDQLNRRNPYWGFKGPKGQMFFYQLVNVASDLDLQECDQEIKAAVAAPTTEDTARSRIRAFLNYVKRLGDHHVEQGGTGHGRPKIGSVPFFLSYFWQVQDRNHWPVYYTNSVQTAADLNLWRPGDDLAENYVAYLKLCSELAELFTAQSGQRFGIYDVAHVFWFKGGTPYRAAPTSPPPPPSGTAERPPVAPGVPVDATHRKLPESYVPPIVAVLPQMALNEPGLAEAAKASGTSLDRAFEKSINAAFTILGYQTQLLGQGQGRVPDGQAIATDNAYAIIWDAKVRANGYSIGTDDRAIREYIKNQSRELKKKRSLQKIYYVIVSSHFADDYDDTIGAIKMETDVNEVCLLEAAAIVAMVDQKLREPHQITLGSDGMQQLFRSSGVLTATDVLATLT